MENGDDGMNNIKKFLGLIFVTAIGLFFVPDFLSLATYIYRLSTIGIIIILSLWIIGEVDDWGIFPAVNFKEIINKAKSEALSAAVLFMSFIMLLCTIIYAILH